MIGCSWIFYFSSSDYRQNRCILVLHRGLVFFSDSACSTLKKGGQKAEINLSRSCSVGWQSRNSTTSVKVAVIFQYLIFDWTREGTIASVALSIFKLQDSQRFYIYYISLFCIERWTMEWLHHSDRDHWSGAIEERVFYQTWWSPSPGFVVVASHRRTLSLLRRLFFSFSRNFPVGNMTRLGALRTCEFNLSTIQSVISRGQENLLY